MIAVLHNIRSMHNVGSIFRIADAAGFSKIYLCGITPTPIDRLGRNRIQIAKISLGAESSVSWEKIHSIGGLLKHLGQTGCKILALEQSKQSIPYFRMWVSKKQLGRTALVLGNEIQGLPLEILKLADKTLEIPMHGKKESLNVAVAFGIVAFHLVNSR